MSLYFALFLLPILSLNVAQASLYKSETLTEKYPHRILTPDYEILNQDDMAYEVWLRETPPYNPSGNDYAARYWQCVPVNDVSIQDNIWEDSGQLMCELEFQFVRKPNGWQAYGGRRALPYEACEHFIHEWQRITHKQKYVCFNGEGGTFDKNVELGRECGWVWTKIKTKKGCFSYFGGECYVKGCSKGKCTAEQK